MDKNSGFRIVSEFDQLSKEEQNQIWPYFERANDFFNQSEYAKAIEIINESLKIKETATAHYFLGEFYLDAGNCTESLKHFDKARDLKKDNSSIYFMISKAYVHCTGYKEAINLLEEFLKLHPNDILTIWQLANMYSLNEDWNNAVTMLEKLKILDEVIFSIEKDNYLLAKNKLGNSK